MLKCPAGLEADVDTLKAQGAATATRRHCSRRSAGLVEPHQRRP